MRRRRTHARDRTVEELEHQHDVDLEAVLLQLRAVETAVEDLAAAIDALAASVPGGIPTAVTDRIESARWALRQVR
jgi:hypothetical protein